MIAPRRLGRPKSGNAIGVLRSCLAGPYYPIRFMALDMIRRALAENDSIAAACRELGVERSNFDRLRKDFPEIEIED